MLQLVIIRGLPGSGKTTLASTYKDFKHFEADTYMCDAKGEYCFDYKLLSLCHELCLKRTESELRKGNSVVVTNTFVTKTSMKPYIELAKKYKAKVTVLTCTGNYQSLHNVPEKTILKMKARWEE